MTVLDLSRLVLLLSFALTSVSLLALGLFAEFMQIRRVESLQRELVRSYESLVAALNDVIEALEDEREPKP